MNKELNYDLIILGGGTAGMSAGIYAGRGALKTAIIDTQVSGGQLNKILEIENYPGFPIISGYDLAEKLEEHADKFNIDKFFMQNIIRADLISKIKTVETSENVFHSKAIIIATGASLKKLGVSGEDEFIGKGVSYCAVCDGAFFRGREICVVGGGNAAVEEAIYLTRFAEKVYIIHRRDTLRAEKVYQERAFNNPKISFIWHTVPVSINGKEKVSSITLKNLQTNEIYDLPVEGIFPYIGYSPNTDLFKEQIELDSQGFIIADDNLSTSVAGVFTAGDVRNTPLRQIIVAAGDGAISATSAVKYIDALI